MLRLAAILLLLANAAFFAWSQGLLLGVGMGPSPGNEPQRLSQQILPEALRVVSAKEGRSEEVLQAAAPGAAECLLAGPIDEIAGQTLRQALQGWPAGTWSLEPVVEPARWIVYLGPYPSAEGADQQRAELSERGIPFDRVGDPALEPGLSLGAYPTRGAASRARERLGDRGLRSARVVQERPETRGQLLRLPAVDDSLRARLDEVRPALAGSPLRPCRQP